MILIGIMSYQGAGHLFARAFDNLNIKYKYIKTTQDFTDDLTTIIMPGGESSVQADFIYKYGFADKIRNSNIKIIGTCAGMILLSSYKSHLFNGLGILDVNLERNFYGTQIKSGFHKSENNNQICFIRAPAISKINDQNIEVLDSFEEKPILIKKENFYAASFHPEISSDLKYKTLLKLIS